MWTRGHREATWEAEKVRVAQLRGVGEGGGAHFCIILLVEVTGWKGVEDEGRDMESTPQRLLGGTKRRGAPSTELGPWGRADLGA